LDTWWRTCLRRIWGIRLLDKVRNADVLARANSTDMSLFVEMRQLRFAAHIERMDDDRWAKRAMESYGIGMAIGWGRGVSYRKQLHEVLNRQNLNRSEMHDRNKWSKKLEELYPRAKLPTSDANSGNVETDRNENGNAPQHEGNEGEVSEIG